MLAITQTSKNLMQMPLRETPTSSIQKFNIGQKQAKQTSKKNHQQLSWKSWNYYIQLIQNTAMGNRQQEPLQKIKKLKIQRIKFNWWNKIKQNVIRKSNLKILKIRKNNLNQKKNPGVLCHWRPYSNWHQSVKVTEIRSRNNARSNYSEQLQTMHLDINLTHQEMW